MHFFNRYHKIIYLRLLLGAINCVFDYIKTCYVYFDMNVKNAILSHIIIHSGIITMFYDLKIKNLE